MPNFSPDKSAVIVEGLRLARSLENSVLLLHLAISELEAIDDSSQEFRTVLALLHCLTPMLECNIEENRHSWERL